MKVLFINNDGGGYADSIEINDGTTLSVFFDQHMGECSPEDYLIRVNRQPSTPDQVLREGDRVSITPTKIQGARAA